MLWPAPLVLMRRRSRTGSTNGTIVCTAASVCTSVRVAVLSGASATACTRVATSKVYTVERPFASGRYASDWKRTGAVVVEAAGVTDAVSVMVAGPLPGARVSEEATIVEWVLRLPVTGSTVRSASTVTVASVTVRWCTAVATTLFAEGVSVTRAAATVVVRATNVGVVV